MTCLKYQYSGPKSKVFRQIEVDKLSVRDIRDMVSDVVNDDDRLYFAKDGVTPDQGWSMLVRDSDVIDLVRATRDACTGVCKIHVFHSYSTATPPNVEDEGSNMDDGNQQGDGENEGERDNQVEKENVVKKKLTKMTARKRVDKGKQIVVSESEDESDDLSKDDSVFEAGNDFTDDFSDEEFAEMRRNREHIERQHETLQEEQNEMIKESVKKYREETGGAFNDDNSISSGSIYAVGSEEESDEDGEFAYTEPNYSSKKRRVNEAFNPCTAGKDIKWRQ